MTTDEWDLSQGDPEDARKGPDVEIRHVDQPRAPDLRRGAFRCPSNGAQCLRGCESAEACDLVAMAEPATDLAPDIPVHRVFMPRVDPETRVPWCSTDCPHYRRGGEDFPPLCSILDDSPTRICEPAVRAMAQGRTEPAPAEGWAEGLALTPAVSYNGQPLPQVAWDLFEVYQSAEPDGLPGTLLLDDKPARFVRRLDGVAVEALREETRAALDSLADGPDVGRMLGQAHERGCQEGAGVVRGQVRALMGEHGITQHDPESVDYEPSRLPALVTALWRLTGAEPDTENHPFKGETVLRYGERPAPGEGFAVFEAEQPTGAHIGGVAAGLEGATWEGDDLMLRDGTRMVRYGGTGNVVSSKVCSCQLIRPESTAREFRPDCPIHGWEA